MPSIFFQYPLSGDWYDNIPDEKSIWFTLIFCREDKKGSFKIYSAIKVGFEGTDARLLEQRINPRINLLEFNFDKTELAKLLQKIRASHKME